MTRHAPSRLSAGVKLTSCRCGDPVAARVRPGPAPARRPGPRRALALCALAVGAILTGCGSDDTSQASTESVLATSPTTISEASRLDDQPREVGLDPTVGSGLAAGSEASGSEAPRSSIAEMDSGMDELDQAIDAVLAHPDVEHLLSAPLEVLYDEGRAHVRADTSARVPSSAVCDLVPDDVCGELPAELTPAEVSFLEDAATIGPTDGVALTLDMASLGCLLVDELGGGVEVISWSMLRAERDESRAFELSVIPASVGLGTRHLCPEHQEELLTELFDLTCDPQAAWGYGGETACEELEAELAEVLAA